MASIELHPIIIVGFIDGPDRLVNSALHGSGASANGEEAAERMAAICQQLGGVDVDLIYNADKTGLL